jgi:hypothetical protein
MEYNQRSGKTRTQKIEVAVPEIAEIEYLIKWERNTGKSKRQIVSILMDRGYSEKDAQHYTETFLGPIDVETNLYETLQI